MEFGASFRVITTLLDQKYKWWKKVGKKIFWSWATSFRHMYHFLPYILYIFCIYDQKGNFEEMKLPNFKKKLFSKTSDFPLSHTFRSLRGNKNSLSYAILKFESQKRQVFYTFYSSAISVAWYIYHAKVIVGHVFINKISPNQELNFKMLYLSEFLSSREIKNVC